MGKGGTTFCCCEILLVDKSSSFTWVFSYFDWSAESVFMLNFPSKNKSS